MLSANDACPVTTLRVSTFITRAPSDSGRYGFPVSAACAMVPLGTTLGWPISPRSSDLSLDLSAFPSGFVRVYRASWLARGLVQWKRAYARTHTYHVAERSLMCSSPYLAPWDLQILVRTSTSGVCALLQCRSHLYTYLSGYFLRVFSSLICLMTEIG